MHKYRTNIDTLCKIIPKDKELDLVVPKCDACLLKRTCNESPYPPSECAGFIPRRWRSCICLSGKWWY